MVRTLEQLQWAGETVDSLRQQIRDHDARKERQHLLGKRSAGLWWKRHRELAEEFNLLEEHRRRELTPGTVENIAKFGGRAK